MAGRAIAPRITPMASHGLIQKRMSPMITPAMPTFMCGVITGPSLRYEIVSSRSIPTGLLDHIRQFHGSSRPPQPQPPRCEMMGRDVRGDDAEDDAHDLVTA